MDFDKTVWSPGYGAPVDRFGIPWMVNTTQWVPPRLIATTGCARTGGAPASA